MEKIEKVYEILLDRYGEQGWWPLKGRYDKRYKVRVLNSDEKFEVCLGAILTQIPHICGKMIRFKY